jgi:hypothetical protein
MKNLSRDFFMILFGKKIPAKTFWRYFLGEKSWRRLFSDLSRRKNGSRNFLRPFPGNFGFPTFNGIIMFPG